MSPSAAFAHCGTPQMSVCDIADRGAVGGHWEGNESIQVFFQPFVGFADGIPTRTLCVKLHVEIPGGWFDGLKAIVPVL